MRQASRRDFLMWQLPCLGAMTFAARGLQAGDDPSQPQSELFFAAVDAGDRESVGRWLDRDGGLLHVKDAAGRSAFARALLGRQAAVAQLLRSRGYEPDLHESALALDWQRFASIAEAAPAMVNQHHPIGGTAFYAAAVGGAGTSIERVYRVGGRPDGRKSVDVVTPLRAALAYPDLLTAEMMASTLLANGADPAAPQPDGESPLHVAAERGSVDLVEMMIRLGAPVGARDARGRRPRERAEESGHAAVARLLANHRQVPRSHSTSRRAYDFDGKLYRAANLGAFSPVVVNRAVGEAHRLFDAVRARLAEHPSLVHAVATTTEGSVEASAHMGQREIVDYLLDRGAAYSLPTAAMRGDLSRARALVAEDPLRIHERGAHDFALLWYPVIGGGDLDMAAMLLEAGAEVERQHLFGTTALHWAAMRGQTEMMELLIEHGADLERVGRKFDPRGETPLQLAEAREQSAAAALLRSRGARG